MFWGFKHRSSKGVTGCLGKHASSGGVKLVDIGGLGWYCQTPKPLHPNHPFFCQLFKSEDNEVAIHQGFGMSWYLDFTHLPVPWGRFVAGGGRQGAYLLAQGS